MQRLGLPDLIGRLMIDRDFLTDLVRDPAPILAEYELEAAERARILQAVKQAAATPESERARAVQAVLMKRLAT